MDMKKLFITLAAFFFLPTFVFTQSVSDLEARIAELLKEFQTLQSELDTVKGTAQTSTAPSVAPTPSLPKTAPSFTPFETFLHKESEGPEVAKLQRFLAQYPDIYPEGMITGYFGTLTESAVKRFQRTYGIVSTGAPTVTGYGLLGIRTREKLNELITQNTAKAKAVVASTPPATVLPSAWTGSFSHLLYKGSEGGEVTKLQEYLAKDPALYPEGTISGYFGALTEAAVKRFQTKHNIVSSGTPTTTGYGVLGPQTRAKLNELMTGDTTPASPAGRPNANNTAPSIRITGNATTSLSQSAPFTALATDDGRPFNTLTIAWSKADGPGTVTFSNTRTANITAQFSETGIYHIMATVSDGVLSASDTVAIDIISAPATTTPATTTTPTATPTLTFSAAPASLTTGATTTLTWFTANVSTCTAGNGWTGIKSTSGSATLTPAITTTYTLSCTGTGGNTIGKEVIVTVTAATTTTNTHTPYTTAIALPGTLQAEHFDKGGEGIAYHETDTTNNGGAFRTTEGVDIQNTQDTGGGYDVGWTKGGEWLEYSVNVTTAGTYVLDARVASNGAGGTFHVEMDGTDITNTLTVPDTGGWQSWTTITSPSFSLTAGAHVLRIAMDTSSSVTSSIANFNFLTVRVPGATPAPTLTLSANPTSVSSGGQSTLTWSTTNATSCIANDGWSGTKAINGTSAVTPTQTATYTLACTGAGGSVTQSVTVSVTTTPPPNQNGLERSGRWFTYNGAPAYLVGYDTQEIASDPTVDYIAALNSYQQYGINKTRIWVYTWFGGAAHYAPWAYSNGRYNLDSWNPTYWARVKDFVSKARDRDIIVEVTTFAPYPGCGWWWPNPDWRLAWNKDYNSNGAFSDPNQFYNLNNSEASNSGKTLRQYQEALIDKTVAELGSFGNVYFEVANEFGACSNIDTYYNWQLTYAQRIANATARPVSVHVTGDQGIRTDYFSDKSYVDTMNFRFNFGISPNDISNLLHGIQSSGKALVVNETHSLPSGATVLYSELDVETQYAWGLFLSGGYIGFYQDDSNNIGSSEWGTGAERLRALRTVAEAANFSTLSPVDGGGNEYDSLVSGGPGSDWQVMANPGATYIAYFWGTKSNTGARINLATGSYFYTWYDTRTASVLGSGSVSGSAVASITAPSSSTWDATAGLVLVVKK
ncbi:MAG: peptidoglycan-binding protein [Patescibacteria group bacterium]